MEVRFSATDELLLREFEDGVVVFDSISWDAHLLNPAAASVLVMCMTQPVSESEVADFLSEALADQGQMEASVHALRLLRELSELGLVSAIRSDVPE